MFSWIPIHKEAVSRMLTFANPQEELLATLHAMHDQGLTVIRLEDKNAAGDTPLKEIDPFTFLASFNRQITERKRKENWTFVKERWHLVADIPGDFNGIPTVHNMKSWFFPYAKTRQQDHVDLLWQLARHAASKPLEQVDSSLFDRCLGLRMLTINKLTIGLFWINPDAYLPVDKKTTAFVSEKGVADTPSDYDSYGRWLAEVHARIDKDNAKISHNAHLWATVDDEESDDEDDEEELEPPQGRRIWAYAPGHGGTLWKDFYEAGVIAIGWEELDDLRKFKEKKQIKKALQDFHGPKKSKTNAALANWEFANVMRPGDVVIVKEGISRVIGFGTVRSDYKYDTTRSSFKHVREVEWLRSGKWDLPEDFRLPQKTLTDITGDDDLIACIGKLVGVDLQGVGGSGSQQDDGKGSSSPGAVAPAPYTRQMAMNGLFMGEQQFEDAITALQEKKNLVLQGPPGVGKTFVAERIAKALIGFDAPEQIGMIQFHQSYSYEDFVQGFRPTPKGTFELRRGIFHQFCRRAQTGEATGQKYVFIIDEINRGNLSKIFGELLMLIEPDKRGKKWAMPLAYSDGANEKFYIPDNVYLIGMMNTADRSLAMVDYALRRRFRFITLEPEFSRSTFREHLEAKGAGSPLIERIIKRMNALNLAIAADVKNLGPGYQIGHSFFCPTDGLPANEAWYRRVVDMEIVPLIREYWLDDEKKVEEHRAALLS